MDDLDPGRFDIHRASPRGFDQAYVHENPGGAGPLVLVHGWPETKRIWWRVIEPLARAGFEVIAPDLRGFGDSDVGPDGFHDVPSHAVTCTRSCTTTSATSSAVLVGGDLGGPVIQDLALRFPGFARRAWCCSTHRCRTTRSAWRACAPGRRARRATTSCARGPIPTGSRPSSTPTDKRRRYIATFYTSRFWAHPGGFLGDGDLAPGRSVRWQRHDRLPHRAVRGRREAARPASVATRACSTRRPAASCR